MQHGREPFRGSQRLPRDLGRMRTLCTAMAAALGAVPAAHAAGNVIVANGRTATRIRVQGNTTDISTATVRGSTAFNAFSQFREASGKIVNLNIPQQAENLLNMVYGGQTVINGVLNAYHNGQIGGHVMFADPQGLVVGAHGVLNVGALTVTTPTRAFMNQVLSSDGTIDPSATAQLLAGQAPQSADGVIRILGQINAVDGISLDAASVLEAASGRMTAGAAAYARMKLFEATVNTYGLQQGTQAVADNGVIAIEGGQSAQIAGTVQAGGAGHGGTIGISAPQVTLADSARLDVSGAQGGGAISIGGGPHALTDQSTAQTVSVAKGATLTANATEQGDGGHVVVWSQSGTDFGGQVSARGGAQGGNGGQVEVSSLTGLNFHGTVDTAAPQGQMGSLLLDPNNLDIVNGTSSGSTATTIGDLTQTPAASTITVGTLQGLGDTNITLEAFNQITVGDSSTGASANLDLSKTLKTGTLTLEAGGTTSTSSTTGVTGAGDIKFESGSSIETGGGSVVLDAGASFTGAAATDGQATLGSVTTDGGAITVNAAGGITVGTKAGSKVVLDSTVSGGTAGAVTLSAAQAAANGGGLLDLSTVYQSISPVIAVNATPTAAATIDVYGTITGGKVSLSASAQAAASFAGNPQETSIAQNMYKKLGLPTDTLLQAYKYASSATAKVIVEGGAHISGANVSLASDAQPTISLIGNNAVPNGTYFTAMAAELTGTSTAQIDQGATVTASGDLSVKATSEPSIALTVQNAVSSSSTAVPSITLAYGSANITTTAQIETGATINMSGGNVDLGASNEQSFSLKASAAPTTTGDSSVNVGIAAVLSDYNTQAVANEGANLSNVGDVTVNAASNTDKNVTSTDTSATASGQTIKPADAQTADSQDGGLLQQLFGTLLQSIQGKASSEGTSSNNEPSASGSTSGSGTGTTTGPSTTSFTLGSAVTLNLSDLSAHASIAKTSGSSASAPTIDATGDVTVHASSSDPGLHNLANSEVASTEPSQDNGGGSSTAGVSLAVALGWEGGGAQASIGNGVSVNAANVAVSAENSTPLAFLQPFNDALDLANQLNTQYQNGFSGVGSLLTSWDTLTPTEKSNVWTFIQDLKTLGTDALKVPADMGNQTTLLAQLQTVFTTDGPTVLNDYNALPTSVKDAWNQSKIGKAVNEIKASLTSPEGMSSYAQAKAEADKASIAGAVDYLSLGSNAQAWVGPGASITLNKAESAQGWSSTVDGTALNWTSPLTVQAADSTYALNGAGNGFLKGIGVSGGGGSSVGVGGAFMWVDASNSAQAWIANGTTITTAGNNLTVQASNLQRFASYAPSSGKGAGFAGNGAAAITRVAGEVSAEIGNQATVSAAGGAVTLNAANSLDVLSIAGALAQAQSAGIGVGVALNFVDPTTTAGVLDTSALTSAVNATAATTAQDCATTYCLTAGALNVEARTQGASIALGVAGAKSGGSTSGSGSSSGSSGGNKSGLIGTITGAFSSLKNTIKGSTQSVSGGLNQTESSASNAQGQLATANTDSTATTSSDGKAGSGASSATQSSMKNQYAGDSSSNTSPTQSAGTEAGSSNSTPDTANQPKMSLAIAGSAAVNINQSNTQASLDAAKIELTGSGGATVLAANNSLDLALAGAGALSSSGSSGSSAPSAAIAGTLGLNVLDHQTTASITDGSAVTLTGNTGASVNVQALSGGQAVSVGLGLAVTTGSNNTLATVVGSGSVTIDRNTTQATLNDATLTDEATSNSGNGVSVQALNAVNIGTGGGALMISKGGDAGIGMAVTVAMLQNQTAASMAGGNVSGFSGMAVQAFSPGLIGSAAATANLSLSGTTQFNLAGAVTVNEIANTTSATIGSQAKVSVTKSLTVQASSQDSSTLENVLDTSTQSLGYDFSGVGLDAFGINTSNGATAPTLGGTTKDGHTSQSFTAASAAPASTPGSSIIGVAGSVSFSKSSTASVGLSAVYNAIANQITAQVGDATVQVGPASATGTAGTVQVSATNATRLLGIGIAAGVSAGSGAFSGVGSFAINNLMGNATTALLGDTKASTNSTVVGGAGETDPTPTVAVNAADSGTIWSGAGGLTASSSEAGVGAALALNLAGQQTTAQVSHAQINASGLSVGATSSTNIDSLAVAVAAADGVGLGGSLDLTIDPGSTQALVDNSALTLTGALHNTATDSSNIWDGAGSLGIGGDAGIGLGVAVNVTHHTTSAKLSSDALSAAGDAVSVKASNSGFIAAGGVGGAASGGAAAGMGIVVNVANDQVAAQVDNVNGGPTSVSDPTLLAASVGSLDVNAADSSQVYALGGGLAGGSDAAVGGAVTVNWLGQQVGAGLSGDNLDVGGALDVSASSTGTIGALSAAIAGSGDAAFAGAVTTNFISGSTTASDNNSSLSGSGLALSLDAEDTSTIDAIGIGAAGSGSAAFGAGVALNSLSGTTRASIDGGSVGTASTPAQNVTVKANSARTINTLAAGAGVGGDAGAAGGIVTDLLNGTTQAYIDGGAQVLAADNVAVLAADTNTLEAATGNLAFGSFGGLGLSVAVNVLNDTTQAYIGQGNGTTDVTALGQGNAVSVDNGQLSSPPSVGGSISDTTYTAPKLSDGSTTVHGVAVNAESRNVAAGLAVGLAVSVDPDLAAVSLEADTSTNVLGGQTQAFINAAQINTLNASSAATQPAQAVSVIAGRHDFATGIATGVAGSTGVAGTGAVDANSFNATTQAYITGGTINAQGAVNVNAYATQDSTALAAGLAAGLAGGAGSGAVNLYQDTTQAYAQGGVINAQSLDLEAHNNTGVNLISGSLSIGAGGSVGASALVNVGKDTTQAWLGDSSGNTSTTATLAGGDLTVKAGSTTALSLLGITGSLSGTAAVAGAVNAMVLNNTTGANVYNATATGVDNATVQAADTTDVSGSYAGGLGAGYDAGVGVALNLFVARNTVDAGVSGSWITASGAVSVTADSTKYANLFTLAGGAGGVAGIGGAVGLVLSGSSTSQHVSDVQTSLNKKGNNGSSVASMLNSMAGGNTVQNDTSLNSSQQQSIQGQSTYAPSSGVIAPTASTPDATTATVSDSTVQADSVSVSATDTTATQNLAGGLAAGIGAGVGAGVAVTSSNDQVGATIAASTITAPTVNVTAAAVNGNKSYTLTDINGDNITINLDKAAAVTAVDGTAGLLFSGGAAVAVGTVNNTVGAEITPATVGGVTKGSTLTGDSSGNVQISAKDGESVQTTAGGANVGGLGVGAAVSIAKRSSNVTAGFTGTADQYQNVTLTANGSGSASGAGTVASKATGIAAGIYSGNAVVADATDVSTVNAAVGTNSSFDISGGALQVGAALSPTITANASGVAVGLGSVGASVANAQEGDTLTAPSGSGVNGSVTAQLANDVSINGTGGLTLSAQASPTINSDAIAGTGALIGGQGVTSTANNGIDVTASTGTGLSLPAGNVGLSATQTGSVTATGTGVLGAALGAGAVVVAADATPNVTAQLGGAAQSAASRTGDLAVAASGTDTLDANSTSGAGGGLIGNAAKASTDLNATTTAQTEGTSGTVYAGAFALSAKHSATVDAQANSTNVSIAGGGAALAQDTGNSTVDTTYGQGTDIQASSGSITGQNTIDFPNLGWNADGSAGGAFNVNVVKAAASLGLVTDVTVGAGTLDIVGDPTQPTEHALTIGAYNDAQGELQAKVATGGVVQGLDSSASVDGTSTANVDVGLGAQINATGNVIMYSGADGNIQTNALAHTWGGAGVLSSSASSDLTANQEIDVAGTVNSNNDVWIGAGYDPNQGQQSFTLGANSQSYNYTVLAVGTNPSASAALDNTNNVTISGSVLAGGSAAVQAVSGNHTATASAIGENSYEKVISAVANFFGGLINDIAGKTVIKPVSLEYRGGSSSDQSASGVNISGTVEAGTAGYQTLTLNQDANGNIVAASGSSPLIQYNLTKDWNYYQSLLDQKAQLESEMSSSTDPQAAGLYFFELEMVNNELAGLYETTSTGKTVKDANGNPIVNPEAKSAPKVTLAPILVRSGNVTIDGGSTSITGTVVAYGAQGVNIVNNTPAFLDVGNITVQGGGGQVYINGALNAADSGKSVAVVGFPPQTSNGQTCGLPCLSIDSTYTPPSDWTNNTPPPVAPDIYLNGTLYDPSGGVVVTNAAGSIHQNGSVYAASVDIAALDGGYFQGYQTGYHNPGDNHPVTNPQASIIAGGSVFIGAQYLNVNGLIQSGHDTLSTTLSSALGTTLATLESAYNLGGVAGLEAAIATANTANKNKNLSYDAQTGYVRVTPAAGINDPNIIPTFWDPTNNRLLLNAENSQPGKVYLYGNIFNTNANAKIIAASGLANIQVDNETGLPLVVNGLNAGSADTGGMVQFIDTAKSFVTGSGTEAKKWNLVTEYQYSPTTKDMSVYHFGAGAPGVYGAADSTTLVGTPTETSKTQYQIATNGYGAWYVPAGGVTLTSGSTSYTLPQGVYRPNSQDFSVKVPTNASSLTYTITYSLLGTKITVPNVPASSPAVLVCGAESFCTATANSSTVTYSPPITKAWSTIPNIYKADNPIKVCFVGPSVGTIDLVSKSGLWLKGGVTNPTGSITLNSADGAVGSLSSSAAVSGKNVTIDAGEGIGSGALAGLKTITITLPWSIPGWSVPPISFQLPTSTPSVPLLVNLVGTSGALNASAASGDIDMTSQGRLALGLVQAPQGSVTLAAQNGIVSTVAGSPALTSGGALNLTTAFGSISGLAADGGALIIDAGGTVNANAPNGAINLTQSSGNFSVGQIDAGSDVTLDAPQGSIVSALTQSVDQKSLTQLQQTWNTDGLLSNTSGSNADAQQNLKSLKSDFQLAYSQYWTLKNNIDFTAATSGSGAQTWTITGLTAAGYAAYKDAAAAYNGLAASRVSNAQILNYVQNVIGSSLITQYGTANAQLGQLQQTAQALPSLSTATLDPSSYAHQSYLSSDPTTQQTQLSQLQGYLNNEDETGFNGLVGTMLTAKVIGTGASWTQTQLLQTVSQQAVTGATAQLHSQTPNIVTPGTITLKASSAVPTATLGNIASPITITEDTSTGTWTLSPLQSAALATTAPGDVQVSGTTITITQHHPIYLHYTGSGSGEVDAQALNGIYLTAGTGDLGVGTISSPNGQIRLAAQGSILQAAGGAGVQGGASGAVLTASTGTIGASGLPLQMSLTGPLDSAQAASDIYLEQVAGGLQLGNFSAVGDGSITVDKGGISSLFATANAVHVKADHLTLNTAGSVGSTAPLAVSLGAGGLSGQVGGALDIVSPTAALLASDLTATGAVNLQALLDGITLDSLVSDAASGPAVTLSAGTSIEGVSPAGTADIAATANGAQVSLTAGTDIGSATRPLVLDAPVLTKADAATGGVFIHDLEGLTAASIQVNGPVDLSADGNLSFSSVIAGGDVTLSSAGLMTGKQATTLGALNLSAGDGLNLADGTADGNIVASVTGDATLGKLAAGLGAAGGTLGVTVTKGNLAYTDLSGTQGATLNVSGTLDGQQLASSAGSITSTSGGDANYGTLVQAADNVTLTSGGTLSFGTVTAGGNVSLSSAGAQQGTTLIAGAALVDSAGGSGMVIDTVDAQNASLDATQGSIQLGTLTAAQGFLSALRDIDLRQAWIADQLALFANGGINANVTQRPLPGKPFELSVAGYGGQGLAGSLDLHTDMPDGLNFPILHVTDATLTMQQAAFSIGNGYIGGRLMVNTPEASLLMNNVDPTWRNVDLQLYQPKATFKLALNGKQLLTNAFTEHYAAGYTSTVPNYWAPHSQTPVQYTTGSGARNANDLVDTSNLAPVALSVSVPRAPVQEAMMLSGSNGQLIGMVNTNIGSIASFASFNQLLRCKSKGAAGSAACGGTEGKHPVRGH